MANPFSTVTDYLFGRNPEAAPKPPALPPGQKPEVGASGTLNLNGFLDELEYNVELKGLAGVKVWDRMRRSDGSVREALWHIEMPIRNATWRCEPASDDPADQELCAFWEKTLHEWLGGEPDDPEYQAAFAVTGGGFDLALSQILSFLAYGFSLFEMVEQVVDGNLSYEDPETGEPVEFSKGPILSWRKLGQRLPQTVWKWHQKDGDLYAVTQRVWKNDSFETIVTNGADLMLFTLNREGDDFTGESILRPAYKAWKLKELVEKVSGISAERFGVGVPVGYLDEKTEDDSLEMQQMQTILKNVRAGSLSYIAVNGPKATSSQPGYLIEILAPPGGIPDFEKLLNYLRAEISACVVSRFSQLGHAQTGARATSADQSKIWEDALHVLAGYIAGVLELGLRRLSRKNFPAPSRWPKIVVEDIESDNLQAFAAAQSALVASGAIIPDKQYRQAVRRAIDMPRESDETTGPADIGYEVEQGVLVGPDGAPAPATDAVTQVTGDRADADAKRQQDTNEADAKTQAKYAPKPAPAAKKPPAK